MRRSKLLRRLLVLVLLVTLTNSAMFASPPLPPSTQDETVLATIDALSVNGVKADSATASDIELVRAGASSPEANVAAGTKLFKSDVIRTKELAQVVLRVPNSDTGVDDLLFVDPKSEIEFGSICLIAGRVLAWAGFGFRLCTRRGVLGVAGTEFEVKAEADDLTVVVFEGNVKPETTTNDIPAGAEVKLKGDGTSETIDVPLEKKRDQINYWSDQIIKTCKPRTPEIKGFENFRGADKVEQFKIARQQALINKTSDGYLNMAKVLNDWDEGGVAKRSLTKVKDPRLIESPEYMVNLAEAERLKGNLAAAQSQIEKTVSKNPDFAPAYYVRAKVTEQKVAVDSEDNARQAVQIRKDLATALALKSGEGGLNANVIEKDLDTRLKTTGKVALDKHAWLVPGYQWLSSNNQNDWTTLVGKASINVGERKATGPARLSISGDQFKLIVAEKIFTGRIVGNKNAAGISFAMQFDAVTSVGKTKGDAVLTVVGTKYPKGLTLQSVRAPSGASFSFTTGTRR
jgi:hypothetical protein